MSMKIAVRLHDLGCEELNIIAKRALDTGFDGVQLILKKSIKEYEQYWPLNREKANLIGQGFKEEQVDVALIGSYFNPCEKDDYKLGKEIKTFKEFLKYSKNLGCNYVGSETGWYETDNKVDITLNRTEQAYQKVKQIFQELADYAKDVNSNVAIEGAYNHCIYSPQILYKLLNEIDNSHVYAIIDIYNYLFIGNYKNQRVIFDECMRLLANKAVIFHLKDFVIEGNKLKKVGLGKGIMDLEYMLPIIKDKCHKAYLVFEGIPLEDMASSLTFVKKILK